MRNRGDIVMPDLIRHPGAFPLAGLDHGFRRDDGAYSLNPPVSGLKRIFEMAFMDELSAA